MNKEQWDKVKEIYKKPQEEFSGSDIEYLMRSDLFKEGGLISERRKSDENRTPFLDTIAFGEIVAVSSRTLHETIKSGRDISPRTYNAIMNQVELRLTRQRVAELENEVFELRNYIALCLDRRIK